VRAAAASSRGAVPRLLIALRSISHESATERIREGAGPMMSSWSNIAVMGAVAAVAIVVLLGLGNVLRGGDGNLSQKLMRWRVGLQFCALLLILTILAFRH